MSSNVQVQARLIPFDTLCTVSDNLNTQSIIKNIMSVITFDTLKFVERLEKAGVPREHAKAEAEALAEVFETGTQDIVTKFDLSQELAPIRTDLAVLKWMAGVGLGIGITILFKLFH
jgi:hypothetical protein